MVLAPSLKKKEGSHDAGIPPPHLRRKTAAMMLAPSPKKEEGSRGAGIVPQSCSS